MMNIKRVILGVASGLLVLGILAYVHFGIHASDAPRTQSQTQIQERKVVQIETITQKVILNAHP